MFKLFEEAKVLVGRVDNRIVRLLITVATLVMFVLAAGAPGGLGGVGM